MAEENKDEPVRDFEEGPASQAVISLSQALLAPLDAIFKAQIHAARSFLNMLLQLGYAHCPYDTNADDPLQSPSERDAAATKTSNREVPAHSGVPYTLDFCHDFQMNGETRRQKISIPALALIPVAPLAVESAEFNFNMDIRQIRKHRQMQKSERNTIKAHETRYDEHSRPWYLVDQPISMQGHIAASPDGETHRGASIRIEVKISRVLPSSGLTKLLTTLTETANMTTSVAETKSSPSANVNPGGTSPG